jgi:hypothetical protein
MKKEIEDASKAMQAAADAIREMQYQVSNFELLDGSAPIVDTEWYSRDIVPPKGRIWASGGDGVWLIHTDGKGISPNATAVKYWTQAFIPCPPELRELKASSNTSGERTEIAPRTPVVEPNLSPERKEG